MQFFLSITFWLVLGAYISHLAEKRGRNAKNWFFIGVLFGVFALVLLLLLKPINKAADELVIEPLAEPEPVEETPVWYFLNANLLQEGPVTLENLRECWQRSSVPNDFLVWCEGMHDWKRVADLPYLSERLNDPSFANQE